MKPNRLTSLVLLAALLVHANVNAADPILVGQWPGYARGPAQAVAVAGNYAYVAAGSGGIAGGRYFRSRQRRNVLQFDTWPADSLSFAGSGRF